MDGITRFFGGSPGRVLVQLVVLSLVVGVVLSALGVSPFDIVNGLQPPRLRASTTPASTPSSGRGAISCSAP